MKFAESAVREWFEWLLELPPTAGSFIEAPCDVCRRSDLLIRIPILASLPHGIGHALVDRLEDELCRAEARYFEISMAGHLNILDIRLRAHDFDGDGDVFEVEYRTELRSRYWMAERLERDRAKRWIWRMRRELVDEVNARLSDLDSDITEVTTAKLRMLVEQIPDSPDPEIVLGDVDIARQLAPRVARLVIQWVDWLAARRWRGSHEVPAAQMCAFCREHWLAASVAPIPHAAQHELFLRGSRLATRFVLDYEFAPPECPGSPVTFGIPHRHSVQRVLARALAQHNPELERAVKEYVIAEIESEAREAARYL